MWDHTKPHWRKKNKEKETKKAHSKPYISTKESFAGLKGKYLICFIRTLTKTNKQAATARMT